MVVPKKSRIQFLKEAVAAADKSSSRTTYHVPYQGEMKPLVIIKTKTDFPSYNVKSGRTRVAQAEYLERHSQLEKNFFNDPEDPRVQKAQHEILLSMIEQKELDKDLLERKQREPLILTCDGFIVDGNRRRAALIEQGEEYVNAVILPSDATSLDIFDTEIERQMARETKAEYDWIAALLNIRHGMEDLDAKIDHLAKRMRKDPEKLKEDLARLEMVDMYLEWRGASRQYQKVPKEAEQAFIELTEKLESKSKKKLTGPAKDTLKFMCFGAIQREEGYQKVRDIITQGSSRPEALLEKLEEDPESAPFLKEKPKGPLKSKQAKDKRPDLLRELSNEEVANTPQPLVVLNRLFEKPETARKLMPALIRATEDLVEEKKETKREMLPVRLIEKATRNLAQVDLTERTDGFERIAKALAKVQDEIDRIAKEISSAKRRKS